MYRVYVWIDGQGFDPDRFQAESGASLGGTVGITKKLQNGNVICSRTYWKTEILRSISGHPEVELMELLLKLKLTIAQMKDRQNIRITAEIVQDISSYNEANGIFIPSGVIQILAELGAGFDFDLSLRQNFEEG